MCFGVLNWLLVFVVVILDNKYLYKFFFVFLFLFNFKLLILLIILDNIRGVGILNIVFFMYFV